MVNADLLAELLAMRSEDLRVREEGIASGSIGGQYDPRMEEVHNRNASRLRELMDLHGWPAEDIAGTDGAEAAWLIVQHAIGEPEFQRKVLAILQVCIPLGRVPAWHGAYLEDRIAMYEGRPQRYGTQWLDDPTDGRPRPWTLADPKNVNTLRAAVGLKPLAPIPEQGPDLPAPEKEKLEQNYQWWRQWLRTKGWHIPA
jgi:hypothetical protein